MFLKFFTDKRFLNFIVIIFLTLFTSVWTFFIFHFPLNIEVIIVLSLVRILASLFIYKDYSLSWSKATQKTFLIKSLVYISAFLIYMPFFYGFLPISFFVSELFLFLFVINFFMYGYYFWRNRNNVLVNKTIVIYGAGEAGMKIESEYRNSDHRILYFIDDAKKLQGRSVDGVKIISAQQYKERSSKNLKIKLASKGDLLIIAMPSVSQTRIMRIYEDMSPFFRKVEILPSLREILYDRDFAQQLKSISLEDLLARHPQDLDSQAIEKFIDDKTILISGAGGSIGSEISRKCANYKARKLLLLDHSEINLYQIGEQLKNFNIELILLSVVNKPEVEKIFQKNNIDVVIHAAAYKHVPLSEKNISQVLMNNIIGSKNMIDLSIQYNVKKFIFISTDKAVRPTNVMGASKRVCELYAQNSNYENRTEILSVRFGNVLGSSGSVIPKFKEQIKKGGPITVTHPNITRYFMLIPEACDLVLQAATLGKGGEIFILDMGKPVRITDLAKKMIELSGKKDIEIKFIGLRPGEKLYEELLISESDEMTRYESIRIARNTEYDILKLNADIKQLMSAKTEKEQLLMLKNIVPEFNHQKNE